MDLIEISRSLAREVDAVRMLPPVAYIYNPLDYAWAPHEAYLRRYGAAPKEVLLLGMNPGPVGMAQTGVPFGDIDMVRDWLGITGTVGHPPREVGSRPVLGFAVKRREPSGMRLWGWARDHWQTSERFFSRFFVANYCPLAFFTELGANVTPDKLAAASRDDLFRACDEAVRRTVELLSPSYAIGIGVFATKRLHAALAGRDIIIGAIPHPSPANPGANVGWARQVDEKLQALGLAIP